MFITTLNSELSVSQFISIYEESQDFSIFFNKIQHFYIDNRDKLVKKKIIPRQLIQEILDSLEYFLKDVAAQNRQRNRHFGRFFTPKSICRFINQRVMKNYDNYNSKTNELPIILDPCAGLGFFLIDMFFLQLRIVINESSEKFDLKNILSHLISCEIDESIQKHNFGLFLSIIGVLLFLLSEDERIEQYANILRENLKIDDFLKATITIPPTIIIGNPPYVRVHKMKMYDKTYLKAHFFSAKYDFDLYVCFFEKALTILPKNGILGYITPEKYLLRKYGQNLRYLMLLNCVPIEFVDISRCKDIFEVFSYPLITILRKNINGIQDSVSSPSEMIERETKIEDSDRICFIRTSQFSKSHQEIIRKILDNDKNKDDLNLKTVTYRIVENSYYYKFFSTEGYRFNFILDPLVEKLEHYFNSFQKLNDTQILIFSGTPRSKFYHQVRNNIVETQNHQKNLLKFIMSRNIAPYHIFWQLPVVLDHNIYQFPQYKFENGIFTQNMIQNFHCVPKLIIKANSRNLTAAIDRVGYSFMGAYGLIWNSSILSLEVLCSIINSDLMNYYITKKFRSYMVNSNFLSINSIIIRNIPLPGKINTRTGDFSPILPQDKFTSICEEIYSIERNLETAILTTLKTQKTHRLEKYKQFLYESQLNSPKTNSSLKIGIYNPISLRINRLNELVYDLYDISHSMRVELYPCKYSNIE